MTGIADAAPRSPEAWKNMGCCADFPQPWADLMWGLEFEDKHPLARVFRQAGASVCEHDCPVRAECLAYAGAAGLEWGLYGGRSCTDRRQIARLAEADGVPCRDRTVPWARRWSLFVDWLQAHPEVFDTARGKASMERGQRRWRAAGRAQPGDGPHDRQTIMQADNQTIRQPSNPTTKQSNNQPCRRSGEWSRIQGGSIMRVALANAKGGVAKTTSCIYLAAVLARRGIEVAVYDADPQSSASLWAAAAEQAGDPLPFDVLPANMATLAHLGGAPAAREWSIIDAPPQGPLLDKTLAVADFVILPTSDSPMDLQQAWDTLDRARHATRAALLPVRVEANTNAWAQTLATLEQTDTARFDTFIAKRQPIKTSFGMNPKQLYEYRELADELTRIAKEELA